MELDDVARDLDAASADLAALATKIPATTPADGFGMVASGTVATSGSLMELTGALRDALARALDGRAHEARALATAVSALAESLRRSSAAYAGIDARPALTALLGEGRS